MRAVAQIVGGVVLGLGLASAVGLDPGLLFAAYTAGLGLVLLCVGRLLLEEPGSSRPANTYPRLRPPLGRATGRPEQHRPPGSPDRIPIRTRPTRTLMTRE